MIFEIIFLVRSVTLVLYNLEMSRMHDTATGTRNIIVSRVSTIQGDRERQGKGGVLCSYNCRKGIS
jgi:hypothetical protein